MRQFDDFIRFHEEPHFKKNRGPEAATKAFYRHRWSRSHPESSPLRR
nr:MAG TPA: hypothetical protein [Caudoviricetes sp.]